MVRSLVVLALLGMLGACGGGGSSSFSVSLSPNPLTGSFVPGALPASLMVQANVSGSAPTETVFVLISDAANTFPPGAVPISQNADGSFSATLRTSASLAEGAHSGTLQVSICADASCNSQLTSTSLPYTITVLPADLSQLTPNPLFASVLPSGIAKLGIQFSGLGADAPAFAQFTDDSGAFIVGGIVPLTYVNLGNYSIGLQTVSNLALGTHQGTLTVETCGDANCQQVYFTTSLPYTIQELGIVAGQPGVTGNVDGGRSVSLLSAPEGLALDAAQNLYVADQDNDEIREITPDGTISTLFKSDLINNAPIAEAIAVDSLSNIYFGNAAVGIPNSFIAKLSAGVTTFFASGSPSSLAVDSSNNVYSVDSSGPAIYKFAPDATQTTLANSPVVISPSGIAVDSSQNVFVSDIGTDSVTRIIRIDSGGNVTIPAKSQGIYGQMSMDALGNLIVVDRMTGDIDKVSQAGVASVVVPGGALLSTGSTVQPVGVAVTPTGLLYISDGTNDLILVTQLR